MHTSTPFKWRHFQAEIILLCIRWYFRYALSYRDLEEIMAERGFPSITRRFTVGCNTTLLSWRSVVVLISKPPMIHGGSMKPM